MKQHKISDILFIIAIVCFNALGWTAEIYVGIHIIPHNFLSVSMYTIACIGVDALLLALETLE